MFKRLQTTDYTVTPFKAYKRWNILVDQNDKVEVLRGLNQLTPFNEADDPKTGADNHTYQRTVYNLIYHSFYRSEDIYAQFGIEDINNVDLRFPNEPLSSFYVIKIPTKIFGERIRPGTVRITHAEHTVEGAMIDDGSGNLVVEGQEDLIIGNVFYAMGVIVYKGNLEDEDDDGPAFPEFAVTDFELIFNNARLEFRSEITHYENEIRCVINDGEFNGVTNPSVFNASDEEQEFVPYFTSDEFQPFITTVGLYDEFLNLVAVAKLPRPIRKPDGVPLTIVVQFDT